ncbi:hypothetical protein LINPERPRIM_LOCUS35510 [Linum perenne]
MLLHLILVGAPLPEPSCVVSSWAWTLLGRLEFDRWRCRLIPVL